ncbi:hypothetical protein V499_03974 [Pseudogymnoascus sp. VKM F-103]|nr:hypothetical protein V499_03974 [Pseudogymnoascus sp. VKM F-103]
MADAGNGEYHNAVQHQNRELRTENDGLRAELLRLNEERAIAIEKHGKRCFERRPRPIDWKRKIGDPGTTTDPAERELINKAACNQYNMSCIWQKHGLHSVPPNDRRIKRERRVANTDVGFEDGKFFNFAGLMEYPEIATRIISYTMVKHTPISVVVRFDVHDVYPPTQGGLDSKTGLSYRFHWGGRACAINSAPLPGDVLAPLLVCKDWYEMFGTAFYFRNSFSFESLGEFQIFYDRTPSQFIERVRAMMITWIGSNMPASNPRGNRSSHCPSRHAMHQLNKFTNLQIFEIRINESSADRMRRSHENKPKKRPLLKSTKNHQNSTENRSLRTLRGLDSITQLRGLERLEIFDYNRKYPRATIRDRTFLEDTRRQVYTPKTDTDNAKADLKSRKPLWRREGPGGWVRSSQVGNIVLCIYGLPLDKTQDERPNNARDDMDDDDNDAGGGDDQNPGDDNDADDDDDDDDQGDNDNHNPHDDSDSESEDDDAPDQGSNALSAVPTASMAGNFGHGGGENDDEEDDDIDMDKLDLNQGKKLGDDSDDDDFEFIHSEKLPPIKGEEYDELEFLHSVKRPTQTIDLSQLPDMEDPDTPLPSIEQDEVKQEVKSEDPTAAESRASMESIPFFDGQTRPQREVVSPFGRLTPRRGSSPQSSLFVRQSPSARSAFSSRLSGYFGSPGSERKRSFEDEDDDGAPLSVRRRLSDMTVTENEIEK